MTKDKSIFIKNIYYMLSYAFVGLSQSYDDAIAPEEFENIHNLFAAILSKGIGWQLKQGLFREYKTQRETLSVVRGKIHMPDTIKNLPERKRLVTCEFDELSENNLPNQILKTAAMILLRRGDVDGTYKSELKKEMLFFSRVDEIDPMGIKWSSIPLGRNNQSYRTLLGICRLLFEGMLLTTERGEYKLASFIDARNMYRLYEKFILEYYRKEHPEIRANASQIPWALDEGSGTYLPVMQSDIMLENRARDRVLIIDAKYYTRTMQTQYDASSVRSAHLYQIFTYVKNKDAEFGPAPHTVSGMLLYAKTDEALLPDEEYRMSGNRIAVRTLDLNTDFSLIAKQLDDIADEYFAL